MKKSISFTLSYVFDPESHRSQYIGAIMYLIAHEKKVNNKNIKEIFMRCCDITGFQENIDVEFACDMIDIDYSGELYGKALSVFLEKYGK